jgi:hypothetical protein
MKVDTKVIIVFNWRDEGKEFENGDTPRPPRG